MKSMRDNIVSIKLTAEELEMLKRGAASEGLSVSEYCRACVIRDRLIAGDPVASMIFKENISKAISGVARASKDAVHKAVEMIAESMKESRGYIPNLEKPKGGRK